MHENYVLESFLLFLQHDVVLLGRSSTTLRSTTLNTASRAIAMVRPVARDDLLRGRRVIRITATASYLVRIILVLGP